MNAPGEICGVKFDFGIGHEWIAEEKDCRIELYSYNGGTNSMCFVEVYGKSPSGGKSISVGTDYFGSDEEAVSDALRLIEICKKVLPTIV